jgi:hypothetical protein
VDVSNNLHVMRHLGIGTKIPKKPLDVSGDVIIRGHLDLSGGGIVMHHNNSKFCIFLSGNQIQFGRNSDDDDDMGQDVGEFAGANMSGPIVVHRRRDCDDMDVVINGHLKVTGDMVYDKLDEMDISNTLLNVSANTEQQQLNNTGLIWGAGAATDDRPFILYNDSSGVTGYATDWWHGNDNNAFYINRKILTNAIDVSGVGGFFDVECDTLNVEASIVLNGKLIVTGTTKLVGKLDAQDASFNNVDVSGILNVNGNLNVSGVDVLEQIAANETKVNELLGVVVFINSFHALIDSGFVYAVPGLLI